LFFEAEHWFAAVKRSLLSAQMLWLSFKAKLQHSITAAIRANLQSSLRRTFGLKNMRFFNKNIDHFYPNNN